ncbi:WD40 repeat protein [Cordyceps javanica]|nr:WD40 repeat protein [Cordyceps javanica]
MASLSVPSSCFTRRTAIWKQLALRSDVDDIILELLGRFSLEKLYLVDGEKTRYQTIMINLLVQLDAIFYIQRLTIPSRQSQPGPFLGFLVSWEIAARTVELVLQTIVEARDNLWEATALRDEYLAEFLLGALRVLQLHPRSPPLQRPKDRRARFARIHRLLEQIFDAYPVSGESSSISSNQIDEQPMEEIPLKGLISSGLKTAAKTKAVANIHVALSQNSAYGLLWSQSMIHVWDLSTTPPSQIRTIPTESTCILATVGRRYVAYVMGSREQKLTLRIMDLTQTMPKENYVVVGFENSLVRFFKTATSGQPREDYLHSNLHNPCKNCASVDTLAFSQDGLSLVASTRSGKGVVQIYLWRFPFDSYEELAGCRYPVPMHESEDNGISSVMMRSQQGAEEGLICVTTWTQSGTPVLIQQSDGHRTEVKPASSTIHGKLGNRIKSAAFSASGRELALVNDKGHLYLVSNLNAMPIDIRRKATSRELTSKNCALVLSFMTLASEEAAVMLWVDPSRGRAFMRKTFVGTRSSTSILETNGPVYVSSAPSRRGPHAGNLTPRSEIADIQELGARTPRERSKGTPRKQLKLFE